MFVRLTDEQWAVVKAVVDWYFDPVGKPFFYLAGYAGTGKSTIYGAIREELEARGVSLSDIVTCAYTGKAANVLRRKGIHDAMTLHSAIYAVVEDSETGRKRFIKNDMGPAASAKLVGLDECSMINDDMADALLSFGVKVLVMGDPGQLPPVSGRGAFTAGEPDAFLREVHRQAAESPILRLATMARLGERIDIGDYGDGVVVKRLSKESSEDVYSDETQPIAGLRKTGYIVTAEKRRRLGFDGRLPMVGERIICAKNDSPSGLFNGGLGYLSRLQRRLSGAITIAVAMDDLRDELHDLQLSTYHFDRHFESDPLRSKERGLKEFDWGYVLTCHKAQGSEWPHVTVVDDSGSFREDRHKWLYTALTRPTDGLTLLKRTA